MNEAKHFIRYTPNILLKNLQAVRKGKVNEVRYIFIRYGELFQKGEIAINLLRNLKIIFKYMLSDFRNVEIKADP